MTVRLVLHILLLMIMSSALHAISVSPTRLEFGPKANVQTVTVTSDAGKTYQAKVVRWKQTNGKDDYEDSEDFVTSPRIFTLKDGNGEAEPVGRENGDEKQVEQVVRVYLKNQSRDNIERAYRLIFKEVPAAKESKPVSANLQAEIKMLINMSLAMYVAPLSKSSSPIEWKTFYDEKGELQLTAINPKNTRVVIRELKIVEKKQNRSLFETKEFKAILANQQGRWSTKIKGKLEQFVVKAVIDDETKEFVVPLTKNQS